MRRRASARRRKKNPSLSWGIVIGPVAALASLVIGRAIVPHFVASATTQRLVNGGLAAAGVGVAFLSPSAGIGMASGFGLAAVGDLAVVKVAGLFGPSATPVAGKIGDPFAFNGGPGFNSAPQLPYPFNEGDSDDAIEGLVLAGIQADLGSIEGIEFH